MRTRAKTLTTTLLLMLQGTTQCTSCSWSGSRRDCMLRHPGKESHLGTSMYTSLMRRYVRQEVRCSWMPNGYWLALLLISCLAQCSSVSACSFGNGWSSASVVLESCRMPDRPSPVGATCRFGSAPRWRDSPLSLAQQRTCQIRSSCWRRIVSPINGGHTILQCRTKDIWG